MIDRIKNRKYGFREDYDPDNRIVKQDTIMINKDKYFISTIDLGIDFSFLEDYHVYFETMIFKNDNSSGIYQRRYSTREEALKNHIYLVENFSFLYNE